MIIIIIIIVIVGRHHSNSCNNSINIIGIIIDYCLIVNARPWNRWGYKSLGLRISRPAPKILRAVTRKRVKYSSYHQIALVHCVTILWLKKSETQPSAKFSRKRRDRFEWIVSDRSDISMREYLRFHCSLHRVAVLQYMNKYICIFPIYRQI